jgi:hypothetical protein
MFSSEDIEANFSELGKSYGRTYLAERVMLAGLTSHGVGGDKFGEAYFETYEPKLNDPNREAGQTLSASRALDAAIAEVTQFKSLAQMQRYLTTETRSKYPEANDRELALQEALLLAKLLD